SRQRDQGKIEARRALELPAREPMRMKRTVVSLALIGMAGLPVVAQDWPMWGGTAARNMTSAMKGLPEIVCPDIVWI
ncbi:MAG: hypothetical protein H6Q94_702, partial [Nitrospirae bacterium]|nr:hypothetical protein [Nitrospirota bacterium]